MCRKRYLSQSVHEADPVLLAYFPASQIVQSYTHVPSSGFEYLPTGQATQVAVLSLYQPGPQYSVGTVEGVGVGWAVGMFDGIAVGCGVGTGEGCGVGKAEGCGVGKAVGLVG